MTWTYQKSTGDLRFNEAYVESGYSGKSAWKNHPEFQSFNGKGPIPRGRYTIGAPFTHPHTGIYSLQLTPVIGNVMFGRSGFLIHGDSQDHPGDASDGCIVVSLHARHRIWGSGDRALEVIE
ncbi:hypothetical protein bAD24_III12340 [Burkholderia sp. AD24]|nr:hypothetical protein bAD24_III12340 [Burkholderia sp. AD24]